ncbi:MAG TPA: CHASE3 domain-containing protein [Chthoniobacterales bacterium]|jgi:signal transduction histidine kinase|nr:CHASE3 domain-containing protein [Chthoniobacterales bacterium]
MDRTPPSATPAITPPVRFATFVTGAIVAVAGLTILTGWWFHIDPFKSIVSGAAPIKPNVGAAFFLCGAALVFLPFRRFATWVGGVVTTLGLVVLILGLATLLEFFLNADFGFDRWPVFSRSASLVATTAWRTHPVTALTFLLMAGALVAHAKLVPLSGRAPLVAGLSSAVVLIGLLPLVGWLMEILAGPQWNFLGMSKSGLVAALSFIFLGAGSLAALYAEQRLHWALGRWTTVAFAFSILLTAITIAGAFNFTRRMLETQEWVNHRNGVLQRVQECVTDAADLASSERVYVITGEERLVRDRAQQSDALRKKIAEVRQLTADNPNQTRNLDQLKPLIAQNLGWQEQVIAARREQGPSIAAAMIATGRGIELSEQILKTFQQMQAEEYRLLGKDRQTVQAAAVETFSLLPIGVFISVSVLSVCVFFLNSGVWRQTQSEEEIRQLNQDLEQRVARRTVELEAANKELEAFSYSVSHDLRAPLRAVDGFSQAVVEDYGPQLPEEARHYLETIRDGARRMGALIDDLLTFSRLSRLPLSRRSISTEAMVHDALNELGFPREGRQVEMRIADLPPSLGDSALLKQVWLNLLSNALKYTGPRNPAIIEVGCTRKNGQGENVFLVRDNGTGFDMRYADKLFGVFQRLHRAEEFEGTGVGLAIVQRIVHRHGGRVWAEAALDQGATFYFTLEGEHKA